MHHSI